MKRIGLVGTGNVASHLAMQFKSLDSIDVVVFSRSKSRAGAFQDQFNIPTHWASEQYPNTLDLLIFCVKDDAIGEVAYHYGKHYPDVLAVHTSGTKRSSVLEIAFKRFGVFYPLQSFTKGLEVDFSKVPMCIYSNSEEDETRLTKLAERISESVWQITDEQREHLHISAVMVNNFSNFLFILAKDYVEDHGMDFKMLIPLIQETVKKLEVSSPEQNQTGPAVRGDLETVSQHLQKLTDVSPHKLIYGVFSGYIKKYFEELAEQKHG